MRCDLALWVPIALALAGGIAVAGCQPEPAPTATNEAAESPATASVANAGAPLDRSALLIAAAKAGSAASLGQDDRADQAALDGRPFEIRIRFGCAAAMGPAGTGAGKGGPFNVRFDSADRALHVRATPDLDRQNAQAVVAAGADAVEGFWMRRPWLLAPGCPLGQALSSTQTASEQRVGIAHAFTAGQREGRRDGQPYEASKVLAAGEEPSRQGYDLVLSGKLRKLPDGRVVACRLVGADIPPECIVAAQFERVRIETPDARTILADWKSQDGSSSRE